MSLLSDIAQVRADMLLLSDASAATLDRPFIAGDAGSERSAPPAGAFAPAQDRSLSERWEDTWHRLLRVAQDELHAATHQPTDPAMKDNRSDAYKAVSKLILSSASAGKSPTTLAYMHGRTTESVRKLRARAGRDEETGLHRERADTAPACDTYADYINRRSAAAHPDEKD